MSRARQRRPVHRVRAGPPLMQVLTYAAVDAALVALLLRERRRMPSRRACPVLLAVFVAAQLPTFFLYRTEAWHAFAQALAAR